MGRTQELVRRKTSPKSIRKPLHNLFSHFTDVTYATSRLPLNPIHFYNHHTEIRRSAYERSVDM